MPKLFLLDAYALIYRSYYAFIKNPRINSKGINTSAAFGFTLTLEEILRKEDPSHIAVVFDPPGQTFRHDIFPEYKANRPPMPEDLRASIPYIRKIIEGFRITSLEVSTYEADDVIGTLAILAEASGFEVFMMTPDKDYMQLVTDRIKMFKPRRSGQEIQIWGEDQVCHEFGVDHPKQVTDVLALWGDSSDNIPGAPGIGEKTAKILIKQFGSIQGIYNHIHELKGKQKESLLENRTQVERALDLVTIRTDVPMLFDPDALIRKKIDDRAIREVFDELEFRTLLSRILPQEQGTLFGDPSGMPAQGSLFPAPQEINIDPAEDNHETVHTHDHRYELVDSYQKLIDLIPVLAKQNSFCFDTETTGLDAQETEIVGLAFSWKESEAWYILFPENQDETSRWLSQLKPILENPLTEKVGQNIKFDYQVLMQYGIRTHGRMFDTMLAHYLLHPDGAHNLNALAEAYLGYKMVPIEQLIGMKGKEQRTMRSVDPQIQKEYAGEDADITLRLKKILEPELIKADLFKLFVEVEMPLISVLADMERSGIRLDPDSLTEFSAELSKDIAILEEEILLLAGVKFNIASPRQLGTVLFEHLRIDPHAKRTKSGQYQTNEEVLTRLAGKHPIIDKVIEIRGLKKLLNTYVDTLPGLIRERTAKIHTHFNQAIASTGRLSSINPNLQNIPIREERGREIRKSFVPTGPDYTFLSADYSQIELRIMAHLSKDENMIAAFNRNEDIHTATAALINRIPTEEVTRQMRTRAKTANFGIIYGISSFGLSQRLQISRGEAKNLIEGYFRSYPAVKSYMDSSVREAREKGFVTTLLGRKRYLPDIHSQNSVVRGNAERNAINSPVQGSAADIIKLAMIRIHKQMIRENLQSKMVLQVHDELNFDVFLPELTRVKEIVRHEMERAVQLSVPLVVDLGTGKNWLEAHG